MKVFLFILTVLISSVFAEGDKIISNVYIYKTTDSSITLADIKNYDISFKKPDQNSTLEKNDWVKVVLVDDVQSGRYILMYGNQEIDLHTFSSGQAVEKFKLHGINHLSFIYKEGRDAKIYYARLSKVDQSLPNYLDSIKAQNFYEMIDRYMIYLIIAGIVIGLIIMAAIYNGALFYFNREKSFLYYALMQVFMAGVLFFHTGMPYTISPQLISNVYIYEYLSLITAFFAVLFARSFLDTKKYLPKYDIVLKLFLLFILLDMLFYMKPIISSYGLYSVTTAYFLVVGYLRMKQRYKPARFYLIGWTALVMGLVVLEYFEEQAYFDTLLLGSAIEAIMLAIALAYKIRQIQKEQEQQKELMIHQSKLASMGEMIGNIAHQWRQPLTHLSYIFMNIEDLDDKKEISKKLEEGTKQLEFMSQTIDDFRDFYLPNKVKEKFSIAKEIEHVCELINLKGIEAKIVTLQDYMVDNYKNEFRQVLLNIIANSKEAFLQNKTKNPQLNIVIDSCKISIQDNAGGIEPKNLEKIFEPYFTTKDKSSGIGLYMSKMIVEKNMDGILKVSNKKYGAIFEIYFN